MGINPVCLGVGAVQSVLMHDKTSKRLRADIVCSSLLKVCGGFTLAETSVVVAIVGVFAAIATPSFLSWYQSKQLNDALVRLEGALRESQREAVRRRQECIVDIPKGVNQTISGTCLVTGERLLDNAEIQHNRGEDPWQVKFDFKGRNFDPAQSGTIVLSIPGTTVSPKCLVISVGIGLMRTGNYDGTDCKKP